MRLSWQVVALVLGVLACVTSAFRAIVGAAEASERFDLARYALDHGGLIDVDGNVYMPGDAEDGTYPDQEA